MTDHVWPGRRCRTIRDILTPHDCIPRGSADTLRYVLLLPGRFLVLTRWDDGRRIPLPPFEIRISASPGA
jgi:hypothetical protein